MATVNKDFKIKHGLVVQGTTGTINGNNILTDADTSDVIDEGTTNLYFTDERAKASATSLLTGSTQTNISITEVDGDLVITAENGVTDSTTDDLDEGTTNLYYTDERARLALSDGEGITYDNETGEIAVDTAVIATREYVDAVAEGLHIHQAVDTATDNTLAVISGGTIAYDNGVDGVGATLITTGTFDTIDGVELAAGNRVLVKNEATLAHNGIYEYTNSTTLTRAEDFDTDAEIAGGDFVFVTGGDVNNSTGWVQSDPVNTIGSDAIVWIQFSGAGTYSGGTGINLDGSVIEIDFTEFSTNDIDEGTTNLYYTDQRVKDVLTGSTQTNISITEVDGDLIITAENGVDDATTDDLDEGTTNLYFTDQRAVDALQAVVPDFDAVEVNSIAKQIAATATLTTAEVAGTVYSFAHAEYRTGKFLLKMAAGSHTEVVEVLLTLDTSNNIAITEYAIVGTNGALGVVSATADGTNVSLTVNPNNANTVVNVYGTLLV
jgi:hypothetical protein